MAQDAPSDFRFLYRTEQGRIDRARWISGAAPVAALVVIGTLALWLALPYANRPLSERAFYDPATFVANFYILAFAGALILAAISWTNLSAKRFRDRGRPAPLGLAGLLPLAALVTGAAHWLQPRVAEVMPRWTVWSCDVLLVIVAIWTFIELFDLTPGASKE
ncbi:MAG: hypothetical protein U1E28_06630 [Beijerinckiaceae bacterium]